MNAYKLSILFMLLAAPLVHSQATFNVQSSGRGLENAKMGARMQQLHDNQQATIDLLQPQSFSVLPDCDASGEKINWNSGTSTFTCVQEDDPTVSSFAKDPLPSCSGTEFLQGDGTDLSCVDATSVVTGSEIDPTVTDFAKDPLPTCGANEALKGNGTVLSCVAISGAGVESDPTVYSFAQSPLPTCGVGQVLKANGTSLTCVTDTAGGFTESDPLTMSFAKGTLPVCAADEVLSNTDGLGQAFACVDAATAAAGAADDLGNHTATQALDMATYAINNVADPTGAQDAATKAYVDAEVAAGVASVSETDPTVETFAKNSLPNCTASQLLSGNGTALSCVDAATAAAGAADDMGDHVADQNIQLGSYYLSGDGDDEGVRVHANGEVEINHSGAAVSALNVVTSNASGVSAYLHNSGGGRALDIGDGTVHMGSERVQDVADPTAAQDAATKAYVDAQIAGGSGDSGTLDGLDSTQFIRSDQADSTTGALGVGNADRDGTLTVTGLAGHDITSANAAGQGILVLQGTTGDSAGYKLRIETNAMQASNGGAATSLSLNPYGGQVSIADHVSATLNMNGNNIVKVLDPVADHHAATKGYVDAQIASGGADNLGNHTVTQNLVTGGYYISNDGDDEGFYVRADGNASVGPAGTVGAARLSVAGALKISSDGNGCNAANAGTLKYVGGYLHICDGTQLRYLSELGQRAAVANVDMASNTIINVATPVNTEDAANKAYVDSAVASGGADNLGDHTATQNIILGSNVLTNDETLNAGGTVNGITLTGTRINQEGYSGGGGFVGITVNNRATTGESGIIFQNGPTVNRGSILARTSDAGATSSEMAFVIRDNDSYEERVTLTRDGLGIGTASPSSTLHVAGDIQIGNDSATCDADRAGAIRYNSGDIEFCNGTAWGAVSASGADNLGDHTATQNIELAGNWLSADGSNSGISYNTSSTMNIELFDSSNAYLNLRNPDDGSFQIRYRNATNSTLSNINFNPAGSVFINADQKLALSADQKVTIDTGSVGMGINTDSPSSTLHIAGDIQIGNDSAACVAAKAGAIRYNSGDIEFCNGTAWAALSSASGVGNAGGNNTEVQYNGAGTLAGHADFTYNGAGMLALTGDPSTSLYIDNNAATGYGISVNAGHANNNVSAISAVNAGDAGTAVYGGSTSASGTTFGVRGDVASPNGTAIQGYASSSTGATKGVYGQTQSASGIGVMGYAGHASGGMGIYGETAASGGAAIMGYVGNATSTATAVYGETGSSAGSSGVMGYATNAAGTSIGVTGITDSASGFGIYADNTAGGPAIGVGTGNIALSDSYISNDGSSNKGLSIDNSGRALLECTNASACGLIVKNDSSAIGSGSAIGFDVGSNLSVASINAVYQGNSGANHGADLVLSTSSRSGGGTTERMRIDEDGNVGIGTMMPSSTLHVAGDIQIGNSSAACAASTAGAMRYNSGNIEYCNGTSWGAMGGGGGADNLGDHTATQNIAMGSYRISADGDEEGLAFNANGTVSVSASVVGSSLYVVNSTSNGSAVGASAPALGSAFYTYLNNSASRGYRAYVDASSASGLFVEAIAANSTGGVINANHADAVGLSVRNTNATGKAIVVPSGLVGIGTDSPSSTLHVSGTLIVANGGEACAATTAGGMRYNGGAIEFCDGSSWTALGAAGGGDNLGNHTAGQTIILGGNRIAHDSGANEGVSIDPNGRGTWGFYADPADGPVGLTLNSLTGSNGTAPAINFTQNWTNLGHVAAIYDGFYSGQHNGHIRIANSSNTEIWLDAAGLVGIGTDDPSSTLHVAGDIQIGNSSAICAAALAGAMRYNSGNIEYCNGTAWGAMGGGGGADNLGDHTATQNIVLGSNYLSGDGGNEGIRIDSTGQVGIGVTNPSYKLDIAGTTQMLRLAPSATGGQAMFINVPESGTGILAGSSADSATIFNGTIVGVGGSVINATASGMSGYAVLAGTSGPGNTAVRATADDPDSIALSINNSAGVVGGKALIVEDGLVGIGTEEPSSTLHVAGDIQVGNSSATCAAALAGAMRYNSGNIEYCNGTAWGAMGGGGGASAINDLSDGYTDGNNNLVLGRVPTYDGTHLYNTAVGIEALNSLSTSSGAGNGNVAFGYRSLYAHTAGYSNTAIGSLALSKHVDGNRSTAIGDGALGEIPGGWANTENTAVGAWSARYLTSGELNIFMGLNAGAGNSGGYGGSHNIMLGTNTATSLTGTGNDDNTIIGYTAGATLTGGSNNILIGSGADVPVAATSSHLNIGNTIYGDLSTDSVGIGTNSPSSTLHVMGDGTFNGEVFATQFNGSSDERLKENIRTVMSPIELIRKIRGVFFTWKESGKESSGVIAQEVQKVMPQAVKQRPDGMLSVEYDQLIAPLIEAVKIQQDEIEALKAQNADLLERVNNLEGK